MLLAILIFIPVLSNAALAFYHRSGHCDVPSQHHLHHVVDMVQQHHAYIGYIDISKKSVKYNVILPTELPMDDSVGCSVVPTAVSEPPALP